MLRIWWFLPLLGWAWALAPQTQQLLNQAQQYANEARQLRLAPAPNVGQWGQALGSARQAAQLEPTAPEVWQLLTSLYSQTLWYSEADLAWQQYLKQGGQPSPTEKRQIAEVWRQLGYRAYQRQAFDLAFDYYYDAYTYDPEHPSGMEWLGRLFLEQGNVTAALPLLEKAQQLRPSAGLRALLRLAQLAQQYGLAAARLFLQGLADYQNNDLAQALIDFGEAAQLAPTFLDAWYWTGRMAFEQRQYLQAAAAYSRVVTLNPNHSEARYWLELSLRLARSR